MKNTLKSRLTLLVASLMAVSGIGGVAAFNASADDAVVVDPVAWYEFKDENNHGKDTMGNYDLEHANGWVEGGTGPVLNNAVIDTENGGATFADGNFCLANKEGDDFFATATEFSLAF